MKKLFIILVASLFLIGCAETKIDPCKGKKFLAKAWCKKKNG